MKISVLYKIKYTYSILQLFFGYRLAKHYYKAFDNEKIFEWRLYGRIERNTWAASGKTTDTLQQQSRLTRVTKAQEGLGA